jgi:hypothetical protein
MRPSLRLKAALALFAAAVALLAAQAIGVRKLAESQEERLIRSIIDDDMHNLLQSYRDEPDDAAAGRSGDGRARVAGRRPVVRAARLPGDAAGRRA